MRKIFGAVFLFCFFFVSQNVFAEKTDWADNSFDFRSVKKIVLRDISDEAGLKNLGEIQKQKMLSSYLDGAKKLKCEILTEGEGDLYIECKIKKWKDDYYIIPEHTVWEQKTMYRTKRDRDGNKYEEKYYITVPVTYPPRRVDTSDLVVNFEVYDAKTGKMVFGREDDRNREDPKAQLGMFGRMCSSFFYDFWKKIKK